MRTVTIDVTQEDIDAGSPNRCRSCPVARAVHRATGKPHIVVTRNEILLSGWGRFPLPAIAAEFISEFDAGRPVSPFSFTLDLPDAAFAGGHL